MEMNLPQNVLTAVEMLNEAGFEACVVGGCVRDTLLGLVPGDWDVASCAVPRQTKEVFRDFRIIDTGIKHGTVTVLIDGEGIEITTYRVDGEYEDNRRPKNVRFTPKLELDLSRRDFTVNAMAYSPALGLVDPFGGREDVNNRIIRCVGEADRRFEEDALRILRALRFASKLDFEIDELTAASIHKNKALLQNISAERIAKELLGLLKGVGARRTLEEFCDVLFEIIPELAPMYKNNHDNPHHCYDIFEHSLFVLENSPAEDAARLAALMHDCGKPACKTYSDDGHAHYYSHQKKSAELAEGALTRLKYSNKLREETLFLIENHDRWDIYEQPEHMRRRLAEFGFERLSALLKLMRADAEAHSPAYRDRLQKIDRAEKLARETAASAPCLKLSDLAVNGRSLIDAGVPEGRLLGEVLRALLDEVLDGALPNERPALISRARELCAELEQLS